MTIRAHRLVVAGSLAVAALAAPIAIALTSAEPSEVAQCRAHFGNIEDNICLDGDAGNSYTIGTPIYNGGTFSYDTNYTGNYATDGTGDINSWMFAQSIPEPGTASLLAVGVLMLGRRRRP